MAGPVRGPKGECARTGLPGERRWRPATSVRCGHWGASHCLPSIGRTYRRAALRIEGRSSHPRARPWWGVRLGRVIDGWHVLERFDGRGGFDRPRPSLRSEHITHEDTELPPAGRWVPLLRTNLTPESYSLRGIASREIIRLERHEDAVKSTRARGLHGAGRDKYVAIWVLLLGLGRHFCHEAK